MSFHSPESTEWVVLCACFCFSFFSADSIRLQREVILNKIIEFGWFLLFQLLQWIPIGVGRIANDFVATKGKTRQSATILNCTSMWNKKQIWRQKKRKKSVSVPTNFNPDQIHTRNRYQNNERETKKANDTENIEWISNV